MAAAKAVIAQPGPFDNGDRDQWVTEDGCSDLSGRERRRRVLWMLRKPEEAEETTTLEAVDSGENGNFMGTLTGVFSPVSLSMFSSLLFLRVGYIVGNAGLVYSVALLAFSYLILGLTILSICAIATNGAVQGGGVYFMISRTLGPELGGSIGILFWAANTVGSALFTTGCIEAVVTSIGPDGILVDGVLPKDGPWIEFGLNLAVLVVITAISIVGPGVFGKFILLFFAVVLICTLSVIFSFLSFFTSRSFIQHYNETTVANCTVNCTYEVTTGAFVGLVKPVVSPFANFTSVMFDGQGATFERDCHSRTNPISLFTVFGVLFSAVTGILAGANLSGELKNPSVSIPKGTISGTVFTFVVYLSLFLLTAATCDRNLLYHECLYMYYLDAWGPFVGVGTICATQCASLSCLLGASRVIHAVGKDNMLGSKFKTFSKEFKGNPVASVLFTSVFVGLLFLYGSLNAIAQLCAVLYLLSYSAINASCFFLDAFSAPNFRPTFRYFHSSASFVGFALTLFAMFAISYGYAVASVAGCLVFTVVLSYFSPAVKDNNWGSIVQNLLLHQVRKYLLKLDPRKDHVKYWRPHVLLLVSNPRHNCAIIHFVNAMKKGGLYVLGHVHVEDFEKADGDPPFTDWLDLIDHLKVKAFAEYTVARSYRQGIQHLVRIAGVGALKPNTVVIGFHDPTKLRKDYFTDSSSGFASGKLASAFGRSLDDAADDVVEYVKTIGDILKIGKNVCVFRHFDKLQHPNPRPETTSWSWYKSVLKQLMLATVCCGKTKVSGRAAFIDVWFLDFFSRPTPNVNARKDLFMLQMAYIVSISHSWKTKLKLRILYRVMNNNPVGRQSLESKLKRVLADERIKATKEAVAFDDVYQLIVDSGAEGDVVEQLSADSKLDLMKIPIEFMTASNQVIRQRSDRTAVTFLLLPVPPPPPPPNDPTKQVRYMELLTELTDSLPPTVMIHGIHSVTSTAL